MSETQGWILISIMLVGFILTIRTLGRAVERLHRIVALMVDNGWRLKP